MSRCQLIKNGFYWNAGTPTSFCCADDDLSPRPSFEMRDWEQKRKTEIQLYNDSLNDWLPSCYSCKLNEQYPDGTSMRTNIESTPYMQNVDDDDYSIKEAIIRTSNTCNLACRMCGPEFSSKWSSVLKNNLAFTTEPVSGVRIPAAKSTQEMTDDDMAILKEKVLTPDLRFLLFSGGEVLLSDWNRQILEYLIEKDLCRNIHVHITTNGTLPFKDSWLTSLQQFRKVVIEYSIDGTDESFDYIRVGHSYEALLDNIQQTQKELPAKSTELHYEFNMVVQAHNAHTAVRDAKRLTELLYSISYHSNEDTGEIPRQFKINACISPDYLSVNILPPALYEKYNLGELLGDETDNYSYNPQLAEKFFRQSAHMDKAHDTSLEQLNPDFFDRQYYSKEQIDNYKKAHRRVWNYGEKDVA